MFLSSLIPVRTKPSRPQVQDSSHVQTPTMMVSIGPHLGEKQ
ncbi:hypothetical protein SLEP1_g15053 [Rubroshorea leprosula]|uniref:Uncharacterized protein n=1 Tax=Rubroshorea leprosula TaxID=152421 RepID=A0AAV5IS85_9ROSI|nr:hypothetical protein SLEP1_g15053 [Rubroshorea leprosula]